ncbi:hypothetical protein Bwad005_20120 [Bilophila wadsworthia]
MWGREPFEKGPSPTPPPAKISTGGEVTQKEFRCIEEKRKLPLPFPFGNNMNCRDRIPDPFY